MADPIPDEAGFATPEGASTTTREPPPFREWLRNGHVEAWLLLDFIARESLRHAPCPTRLDWARRRFSALMEDVVASGDETAIEDMMHLMAASLEDGPGRPPVMPSIRRFLRRERRWLIDHLTSSRDKPRSP